jgi:predicted transcriptional regulator
MSNENNINCDTLLMSINELKTEVDTLAKFVDTNDANIRDNVGSLSLAIDSLKVTINNLNMLLYGSGELRLKGMTERLENTEEIVEAIVDARRSERDKLRGIQIGLAITGFSGVGSLIMLVSQWLG